VELKQGVLSVETPALRGVHVRRFQLSEYRDASFRVDGDSEPDLFLERRDGGAEILLSHDGPYLERDLRFTAEVLRAAIRKQEEAATDDYPADTS
jgi:hypothetical protein